MIIKVDDSTYLKSFEPEEAEELFFQVERSREYLRQWLPWLDSNVKQEDSLAFIKRSMDEEERSIGLTLGLWHNDKLAGVAGYNTFDWANRIGFIGYWLAEGLQGHGIMTNACRALVSYGFCDLGLNRAEIICAPGNHKSRAIPERLGFRQEGTIREREWLYDHFVDGVVYGMLAREWGPPDKKYI